MLTKVLLDTLIAVVVYISLLLVFQDLITFPGAFFSWRHGRRPVPEGVERQLMGRLDNPQKKIEMWRYPAAANVSKKKYVAVIFSGNGDEIVGFFAFQKWFSEMGITSYTMNYRGYGSSDWYPTAAGILADAKQVTDYALANEKISPENLIVFCFSLGSGVGSYIANLVKPAVLIMLGGYTSTINVAKDRFFVKFLAPLLWTRLNSIDNIKDLRETKLLLAHGLEDREIRPWHGEANANSYQGIYKKVFMLPGVAHNDLFSQCKGQLQEELLSLLDTTEKDGHGEGK
ncbi:MAG: alpha/beta hydrolase [Deltaproteobacteria bacterium]|nr:alpha/beta hydrolase [Deltaproteobacteria bacterium]